MLVANRVIVFLSLADIGLLCLIAPLTVQTLGRVIADSHRFGELSERLQEEVRQRIDERDNAWLAKTQAEKHVQDLVGNLNAIVWEADAATLRVSFVSEGAGSCLDTAQGVAGDSAFLGLAPASGGPRTALAPNTVTPHRPRHDLEDRMLAANGRYLWFRDIVQRSRIRCRTRRLRRVMVDNHRSHRPRRH